MRIAAEHGADAGAGRLGGLWPALLAAVGLAGLVFAADEGLGGARPAARAGPITAPLRAGAGQSLRAALRQAGLDARDADGAADALADQVDPDRPDPAAAFELRTEPGRDGAARRLIDLVLRRQGQTIASVTRAADGSLRLNLDPAAPAPAGEPGASTALVQGPMEDVLYGDPSAEAGRADPVAQATRLFARKLDLTRDIALGDRVRLVVTRPAAGEGRLLYAEIDTAGGATRYWAHRTAAGQEEFVGAGGETSAGELLRTPLAVVRITSAFGMRLHPLLGYSRLHAGVDFGAPPGTPVVAAADGVVEAARWAGGYGRWIELRHSPSLETGYGHLSAWAAGLGEGQRVRQGEVIGYVGSSGLSTGPHLHFEVREHGQPIDPESARLAARTGLSGADLARFAVEQQAVATLLDGARPAIAADPR